GLWLSLKRGNPPELSLWSTGLDQEPKTRSGRVSPRDMDPEWIRWLALGEGKPVLVTDPWGDSRGGPWQPIAIPGELPAERLRGPQAACPGGQGASRACTVTGARLGTTSDGRPRCGSCQFHRVLGLMGLSGASDPRQGNSVEAIAPALGALCVN